MLYLQRAYEIYTYIYIFHTDMISIEQFSWQPKPPSAKCHIIIIIMHFSFDALVLDALILETV